jgi:hypothetical protein
MAILDLLRSFDRIRLDGRSCHITAGDAGDQRLVPRAANRTRSFASPLLNSLLIWERPLVQ